MTYNKIVIKELSALICGDIEEAVRLRDLRWKRARAMGLVVIEIPKSDSPKRMQK